MSPSRTPLKINVPIPIDLFRADICYSSVRHCPLRLPKILELQDDPGICDCLADSELCQWQAIQLALSQNVDLDLLQALQMLHGLPRNPPPNDSTSKERQRISRTLYMIQWKLIEHEKLEGQEWSSMIHCAIHLYALLALRDLTKNAMVEVFCIQLAEKTKGLQQQPLIMLLPEEWLTLLLWASLLQLGACEIDDSRMFSIVSMLKCLGVQSYEELLLVLRRIAWADGFMETDLRSLLELSARQSCAEDPTPTASELAADRKG